MRRILHASDFSAASRPAFERAVEMARANRAGLLLVHVITRGQLIPADFGSPRAYQELHESVRRRAEQELEALRTEAARAGVRATSLVLEGGPGREIVRAASARKADLIVVGTHGRTGLPRFFLGSVATRVVATAPCPVVTVRPDTLRAARRPRTSTSPRRQPRAR